MPPVQGQERAGIARGQNTVHTLPHDAAAIRQFLTHIFDRVDASGEPAIHGVVLAADAQTVMAIGRVAATMERPAGATVLAVPSAQRGARALRSAIPTVLVATPGDLLALMRESLAKLSAVRATVFAWADDLLAFDEEPLATIVSDLPKDAARLLVAARLTSEVEAFAERFVRRVPRGAPAPDEPLRVPVGYVAVAGAAKPAALRRILDLIDPATAVVYARTDEGARAARAELEAMGSAAHGVRVSTETAAAEAELLLLFELPASPGDLRALTANGVKRVVALARSREMPLLRALAGTHAQPLTLAGPAEQARAREEATRDALRAVLAAGVPSREILALEPLLEEYDAVEIAAAALRLLERGREGRPAPSASPAASPSATSPASPSGPPAIERVASRGTVRVFINVGTRDGAAARDLVGAIVNVAGVPVDRIGKVELRESHALVELQSDDADLVVEKLTGSTIRGRRVAARADRDRAGGDRGPERPRERSDRFGSGGGSDRTRERSAERTGARGDRSAGRGGKRPASSERTGSWSSDRKASRATERSSAKSGERPAGRGSERSSARSSERPAGRGSERPASRGSERPGSRGSARPPGRGGERSSSRGSERSGPPARRERSQAPRGRRSD